MSFKPEVLVQGKWSQNNLAFETEEEALASAKDLFNRWFSCSDFRAVSSDQAVNYKLVDGVLCEVSTMTADDFRAWRKRLGWSKVQAARELGISQASVSLYEAGFRYDTPKPVIIPKPIVLACRLLEQQYS